MSSTVFFDLAASMFANFSSFLEQQFQSWLGSIESNKNKGLAPQVLIDAANEVQDRSTLLRSSSHVIRCFHLWLKCRLFHCDICVSREGFTSEAFFEKLTPLWNLMRRVSRCLDT